jgi:hypothetical protein
MKPEKLKENIVQEVKKIKPLLSKIADFYLYGSMGYRIADPGDFPLGDNKIPDIRREEVRGIKDAISAILDIDNLQYLENMDEVKNIIIGAIKNLDPKNKFYDFGRNRVVNFVEHFSDNNRSNGEEQPWSIVFLDENELVVPDGSDGVKDLIRREKIRYFKTYSFMSQIKKYLVKEVPPEAEYFYSPIKCEQIGKNFELAEDKIDSFIFRKLYELFVTFYPTLNFEGVRMKMSIYPPLFYFVSTSEDVIFIYLMLEQNKQAMLFLLPLSDYANDFKVVHFNLVKRYTAFLEGKIKDEHYAPFVFWVKKKNIQTCIPPDAKVYYSVDDNMLFFSRETGFFFQVLKEAEPYYLITILPQEYMEELLDNEGIAEDGYERDHKGK